MNFQKNVGPIDRTLRIVVAVALAGMAVAGLPGAPAVYATAAVAVILAATGLTGFCPLYALLGIRTTPATR
jgi:hypothetical protein